MRGVVNQHRDTVGLSRIKRSRTLTGGLAEIKSDEDSHHTADDQYEAHEVELLDVLAEGFTVVGVKVKEEPEDGKCHAAGRSAYRWMSILCGLSRDGFVQVNEEAPVP